MSQITGPITINDGSATPVATVFSPERVSPEQATFTERSAGSSAGFVRLGVQFSPASSKRATNRIDLSLDLPVLQTIGGVSSVAYIGRFKGYFIVPDTMTVDERANLHAFVANALNDVQVRSVIRDLDPMY